jgi:hypothetical protein
MKSTHIKILTAILITFNISAFTCKTENQKRTNYCKCVTKKTKSLGKDAIFEREKRLEYSEICSKRHNRLLEHNQVMRNLFDRVNEDYKNQLTQRYDTMLMSDAEFFLHCNYVKIKALCSDYNTPSGLFRCYKNVEIETYDTVYRSCLNPVHRQVNI